MDDADRRTDGRTDGRTDERKKRVGGGHPAFLPSAHRPAGGPKRLNPNAMRPVAAKELT